MTMGGAGKAHRDAVLPAQDFPGSGRKASGCTENERVGELTIGAALEMIDGPARPGTATARGEPST